MTANEFLRPLADDFRFEALRFPGEEMLRRQVERRPAALETIRRWCSFESCPVVPKSLHAESFAASPAVVPALAQLERMLQAILKLDARPEIVPFPSGESFIGVFANDSRSPLRIAVSSAAIHRFGVRESLFQIGRRLAWRMFDHFPLLADPTSGDADPNHDSLMIRGLWKFQELTADRVGLLCCQDAELAARSVIRFASGLPDDLLEIDWDALLAERIGEEEAILADSPYQFALLRAAAIRQFSLEDKFAGESRASMPAIETTSEADSPASAPIMEGETVIDVTVVDVESMEPEYAVSPEPEAQARDDKTESWRNDGDLMEALACDSGTDPIAFDVSQAESDSILTDAETESLREFSLWGALWVVGVESALPETARAELWEFFGSEAAAAIDEAGLSDGDERCARRCAAAAMKAATASVEHRRSAIEDVIHLAHAAGPIRGSERERIADLAELLELTTEQMEEWSAVEGQWTEATSAVVAGSIS